MDENEEMEEDGGEGNDEEDRVAILKERIAAMEADGSPAICIAEQKRC